MEIKLQLPDSVWAADKDFSRFAEALQLMLNRMAVSHFKYGLMANSVKDGTDCAKSGRQRLTMYDGKNWSDTCDCEFEVQPGGYIEHQSWCVLQRKHIPQGGTGNTENLLDAANFFVIEHLFPRHAKAHFFEQETRHSPGLATVEEASE